MHNEAGRRAGDLRRRVAALLARQQILLAVLLAVLYLVNKDSDGSVGPVSEVSTIRLLGRTGLTVSPLMLGTMEFGSKVDVAEAGRIFAKHCGAPRT